MWKYAWNVKIFLVCPSGGGMGYRRWNTETPIRFDDHIQHSILASDSVKPASIPSQGLVFIDKLFSHQQSEVSKSDFSITWGEQQYYALTLM